MRYKNLKPHPLASTFPMIGKVEFKALVEDIAEHGLREPVVLFEGKVLDGRNRLAACRLAKVKPTFQRYVGDDPLGYVVSLNLRRRHLTESQRAMVAARISRLRKGANQHTQICGSTTQGKAAKMLNVSPRSIQHAAVVRDYGSRELKRAVEDDRISVFSAASIAQMPKAQQRKAIAKLISKADPTVVIQIAKKHRQKRAERRHKERIAKLIKLNGKNPKLDTSQRFSVVYADCPLAYDFAPARRYSPASHYPTMSVEQLCKLPIHKIAAPDCVLFLWAPAPKLIEALEIMRRWGFAYRTNAIWEKPSIGVGHYFRQAHELLLLGRKGNPPIPLPSARPSSVIKAPRQGHSVKPSKVYEIIERMFPKLPKIELFARGKPRVGWAAFGNEVVEQAAA